MLLVCYWCVCVCEGGGVILVYQSLVLRHWCISVCSSDIGVYQCDVAVLVYVSVVLVYVSVLVWYQCISVCSVVSVAVGVGVDVAIVGDYG